MSPEGEPQVVVLVAAPRTGSTVLGEAIAGAFALTYLGEVFHDSYADPETDFRSNQRQLIRANFFNFRASLEPAVSMFPSLENRRTILAAYLDYIGETFGPRVLIDLKYTASHHLDGYWRARNTPPGAIELLAEADARFVHLRRRNLFAQYCSFALANQTGEWSSRTSSSAARRLTLNARHCEESLHEARQQADMAARWMSRTSCCNVFYEDLFDGADFSDRTLAKLRPLLGHPSAPMVAGYRKQMPSLGEVIENRMEVLTHFRGTEFRTMVEQALA